LAGRQDGAKTAAAAMDTGPGISTPMIVDCYTHIWDSAEQLGRDLPDGQGSIAVPTSARVDAIGSVAGMAQHAEASRPVDTAFVLAFKSHYLDAEIPNEVVANYVRRDPEKLVGFAGVDPSRPQEAVTELAVARDELGMRGIAVAPCAQNFHPADTGAMRVYEKACELGMPVLFHPGIHLAAPCKLAYAQPVLLDEVACEFPELKVVIAHMGYPWTAETVVLLVKHPNVYADISWLLHRPWAGYQALVAAHNHGVMDKLLFGSGFPYTSAAHCIEALYSINHLVQGTNLPTIPREQLRGIVERNALDLLGITPTAPRQRAEETGLPVVEDEP
jgi:predicted TIM-barrel fold metal-dependent hydrolase